GADTVLATDNQPSCAEPLLKRNRGIFKDGASLERERGARVARVALPHALVGKPSDLLRSAGRTLHDAIGPPQFHHELAAMLKICKPDSRVSEGVWRFHVSSMRRN